MSKAKDSQREQESDQEHKEILSNSPPQFLTAAYHVISLDTLVYTGHTINEQRVCVTRELVNLGFPSRQDRKGFTLLAVCNKAVQCLAHKYYKLYMVLIQNAHN